MIRLPSLFKNLPGVGKKLPSLNNELSSKIVSLKLKGKFKRNV